VAGEPLRREELLVAIGQVELTMSRLQAEQQAVHKLRVSLQYELDKLGELAPGPTTAADKVKLFRSLFRGRQDVFPIRFVSKKTGKPGYAPVCDNKFVRGLCELPKIKCGECTNQAFVPYDDAATIAHLTGRHVMGVYPLLHDDTCWFLAVDFDKHEWRDDVAAFVAACQRASVPFSVEKSRSGNGAHVWFFFVEPVPASTARKMGCYLLTDTMAQRHQLAMSSYDRLFPSQDRMVRGGFGNLIALPLQHEARNHGNSLFLDEALNAYPDDQQWAYLASVQRIDRAMVEKIADQAMAQGSLIAGFAGVNGESSSRSKRQLPLRAPQPAVIAGPLPAVVDVVLAAKLLVAKAGLPAQLMSQIKELAVFQNPEFYKKQGMRLSTALTPRVIDCSADSPLHIGLPRGLLAALTSLLRHNGIALEVSDERSSGSALSYTFHGALTDEQQVAVNALLAHDIGTFVAPPGVGKTVVGTYLVAARACSTLIVVHRRPLLDQWVAQLALFLGIDAAEIGQIGAGRKTGNGKLDVAMIQSLMRKDRAEPVDDPIARYGQVIVDECHHLPAVSFERVIGRATAKYLVGLTATPQRRDGHQPITEMQLGPVRHTVNSKKQATQRPFKHTLIVRDTRFGSSSTAVASMADLYSALALDERRNQLIINDVIAELQQRRSPIVLTERKDHLDYLCSRLMKVAKHVVVLHGGMNSKARSAVQAQLASIPSDAERLVLATGRYIGEGFDDARLDTLFLALPVSWKGTLTQYAGRLHRLHAAKCEVRIFDYVDGNVPMLARMFDKRLRGYRAMGYVRSEAPATTESTALVDDYVVEYDSDAAPSPSDWD
jgi:superfamily II DNA or RNA helicase